MERMASRAGESRDITTDIFFPVRVGHPELAMTTIPTRLARAATQSTTSAHQRKRVLDLYREWMRGVCFSPSLTYHLFIFPSIRSSSMSATTGS